AVRRGWLAEQRLRFQLEQGLLTGRAGGLRDRYQRLRILPERRIGYRRAGRCAAVDDHAPVAVRLAAPDRKEHALRGLAHRGSAAGNRIRACGESEIAGTRHRGDGWMPVEDERLDRLGTGAV